MATAAKKQKKKKKLLFKLIYEKENSLQNGNVHEKQENEFNNIHRQENK